MKADFYDEAKVWEEIPRLINVMHEDGLTIYECWAAASSISRSAAALMAGGAGEILTRLEAQLTDNARLMPHA